MKHSRLRLASAVIALALPTMPRIAPAAVSAFDSSSSVVAQGRLSQLRGVQDPGDSLHVEPCACQGDLRRRQRIVAANIPRRYLTCRIKNFNDREAVLKTAKARVEQFVNEWMPQFGVKGMLLMGGCGSGKTHLAVAALQEIIQADKPGKLLFSNFSKNNKTNPPLTITLG